MARKSKGFGKLLKQQQAKKAQQKKALSKLEKKVRQGPLGQKVADIVKNPKGEVKMSEVLEQFVEPYLDIVRNRKQRENLFGIAIVAWNLAIMPENERQSMIEQFVKEGSKGSDLLAQRDIRGTIDELIARKKEFFADNQRYIVDFQLQDMGEDFHLSVVSTLMP